jgi:hypothetical protein
MKWYIGQPTRSHLNFTSLIIMFLTLFQFPIRCDEGAKVFLSFHQTTTTHIMDHIHEWCTQQRLCKIKLDYSNFLYRFFKSVIPIIAKDVLSTMPQTEEESIFKAQQLDLIYAQSSYLYTIPLKAPCSNST